MIKQTILIVCTIFIDLRTSKLSLVHVVSINPLNSILIGAKRISDQLDYTVIYDFRANHTTNSKKPSQLTYLSIGEYVACIYDNNWYIGMIREVCAEEGVKVALMHPKGPGSPENSVFWPPTENSSYVPTNDIMASISTPKPSPKGARKFKISTEDIKYIIESRNL